MARDLNSDQIRDLFSKSMSAMYKKEVPQYGMLLDLVADINRATLREQPDLQRRLEESDELSRLDVERHGAIRLGTAQELATMRRIFNVMGMHPVGYYDLSVAGVPVHATAFRPTSDAALRINPFRVFTSLLRLELIASAELREQAQAILARRQIFTPRALELTQQFERDGRFGEADAAEFVQEVTQTFRWHGEATVDPSTYKQLHAAHRLVADVVCFKGPHINHLTPRTLDIDEAQLEMPRRGIAAKDVVEGPPRRKHAILLRQTSFKALEEKIAFTGGDSDSVGAHTARFGEIEQRGVALTRAGRALYDRLLGQVRSMENAGSTALDYQDRLAAVFREFPDDLDVMHNRDLAFFRYRVRDEAGFAQAAAGQSEFDLPALLRAGVVESVPITYEDFLPVSAAGIFQSNIGGSEQKSYAANAAKEAFEAALQAQVADEIELYEQSRQASIASIRQRYLDLRGA